MRYDLEGFFWEDTVVSTENGKEARVRPLAPIPNTGWKAPTEFPNLFNEKIIGLDIEGYDPELRTHGPGWARGVGHVIGVSVATAERAWYFPFAHETQPEDNMDREAVFLYLRDLLGRNMPKVGANLIYDTGWLQQEGITTKGTLYDVQYAEALLYDTARSYSLESVAERHLGVGKESNALYKWCARSFGGKPDGNQRKWMYKTPPCLAGPYAEADANLPVKILLKQYELLRQAGMWDLFQMECDLIPVLQGMRFRGLPISVERAEQVEVDLEIKQFAAQQELNTFAGFDVGVHKNKDLQRLFDTAGIKYPITAKGNPSFTAKFLSTNASTPSLAIQNVRKLQKAKTTFIRNAILNKHVNGVLYPSFHPLRGEDGGAVSGRYSSSMPNAQQIPARDQILAPLIRSLFIPEKGFPGWLKLDLSQIEYRFFAHYSNDTKLITEYQDPKTDYHDIVSGFLQHLLIRKIVKNFNFMSLYGGGKDKTIAMIGEALSTLQVEEMLVKFELKFSKKDALDVLAIHFINLYATSFPAAKRVMQECSTKASTTGEIRTILNRRSTFELWEPAGRRKGFALPFAQAVESYGTNIRRHKTYKALNRKLQGSAADLLKKGMLDAYKEGLFAPDRLGFPHVTVHDELDFSYHPDQREDAYLLKIIIENAIKLKVPVIMDAEVGTNWGNVKEIDLSK